MNSTSGQQMLIIGNGGAAIHAIKALREAGFSGKIHQVSDEESAAFNPMLAPYYLKNSLSWQQCFPFGRDFYQNHDVTCHFGAPVEYLDARNKTVTLKNNVHLSYDKCLLATGARVTTPPIPGLTSSSYALPLRTPASTLQMQKAMGNAQKVVVLGASLVGVKVAEILIKHHVAVILLDVAAQLLPRGAHPETAAFLKTYFENQGIDIRLGCSIEGLEDAQERVCCYFPDAIMEEADFVAVCTGIHPNLDFVDKNQVEVDQAILVNERLETSACDLYAAGDVSQGYNLQTGRKEWLGTWNNACCQGRAAGMNMAGRPTSYNGCLPQHISPIFDWTYAQIGNTHRVGKKARIETTGSPYDVDGYALTVYEDDVLVGANIINRQQDLNTMKKAVSLKTNWPLEHWIPSYF